MIKYIERVGKVETEVQFDLYKDFIVFWKDKETNFIPITECNVNLFTNKEE